jgi:predicted NAD/FAD-binding protein
MPRRRIAWSAWNYLTRSSTFAKSGKVPDDASQKVSLTYNMNILQHIPEKEYGDVLVTMNPLHPPSPSLTQGKFLYHHPLYTPRAVQAQEHLKSIQGKRGIWYAGAWTGYGFHEDGFTSGIRIAVEGLGGKVAWDLADAKFVRGKAPVIGIKGYIVRLVIWFIQCIIVIVSSFIWTNSKVKKLE